MTINEIAGELYEEMFEPSDITPAIITFWMRNNIGALNNSLATSFTIKLDTGLIDPDIGDNEKAVFKKLYEVRYYDKKIRETLNLATASSVLEVSDVNGGTVRLINKNELAKTYIQLRKDALSDAIRMANDYKSNVGVPLNVEGNDTIAGYYKGGHPYLGFRYPNP